VFKPLQEIELVKYHLLIPLDVLLQDDLDGHPAIGALGLPDDAIGAGAERTTEAILGPGASGISTKIESGTRWTHFLS